MPDRCPADPMELFCEGKAEPSRATALAPLERLRASGS